MSASWLRDAVFYEIYPQSFRDSNGDGIGDLPGITEKLPYVKSLGCNALWSNPCFDSPFTDAGYDVRDYKKIAPRYGTNEDMAQLCRRAHALGIRVLLDLFPATPVKNTNGSARAARPSQTNIPAGTSGRIMPLPGATVCPSSAANTLAAPPISSTSSNVSPP